MGRRSPPPRLGPDRLECFDDWIGETFAWANTPYCDKFGSSFGKGGLWKIEERISAHITEFDPGRVYEAKAVFRCRMINGHRIGDEAIIKAYMQLPPPEMESNSDIELEYGNGEPAEPITMAYSEIDALKLLTEARCPVTPRLLNWSCEEQRSTDPVPGGYIVIILMEKLPGTNLCNFWSLPRETRDIIRDSFVVTMHELYQYLLPSDPALRNIMWDEKTGKCFVLDFEVWECDKAPYHTMFPEKHQLRAWDLVQRPYPYEVDIY